MFKEVLSLMLLAAPVFSAHGGEQRTDAAVFRQWVAEMKAADRGPFEHVRWFCKDGSILDPTPYACTEHGGGAQHGEWTGRVKQMRANGFRIANIYEDLDIEALLREPGLNDIFNQMLLEQFLTAHDDGWIYRKARYYRGAMQAEGEARGGRKLLLSLLSDPAWTAHRFLPLRAAVRLLPNGQSAKSIAEVRALSAALADKDRGFVNLRNKIHGHPEAGDAELVRAYAKKVSDTALAAEYGQLAAVIDGVYSATTAEAALEELIGRIKAPPDLQDGLKRGATALAAAAGPAGHYAATATAMVQLRELWPRFERPETRLAALRASLALENEHFASATSLKEQLGTVSRRQQLDWLAMSAEAAYGAGLLSAREITALRESFATLSGPSATLADYRRGLDYAALAPGWATQWLRFHFQESIEKFSTIEPRVGLYPQEHLRSSPLFFYAQLIDGLLLDANRLAGVRRELFGAEAGGGLRALNPGLARGTLHIVRGGVHETDIRADGIYLLPETTAELPPVAGILTEGEGNPLSHVQLLARNLGIPNVAVDPSIVGRLEPFDGRKIILAVSAGGAVQVLEDTGQADAIFGSTQAATDVLIKVDLEKLDLSVRDFVPLTQLRAGDSGRSVGPKAAKLGELKAHFPDAVADGLAIPFGVFRKLLEQPMEGAGKPVFEWMSGEYARLAALPAAEKAEATEEFRQRLESWVEHADPGEEFRTRLRQAMKGMFGEEGTYGVYVRSDTNVEDLGGFTGAGLNLTLPNVVGFDNVVRAIARVWASPFTARSFAWRQSRMDRPEHVYPAVLLLKSVNNDKSGVMVTRDIDNGDPNVLSIAVNEGVGGAVDGQAAESLRIEMNTGRVRLLAPATAPYRRLLPAGGDIKEVPVSGEDAVLKGNEIPQLIELARELPARFPPITDADGKPAAADIEFGFVDGRLRLFQIRPVNESRRARGSEYLIALDRQTTGSAAQPVDLAAVPGR